MDLSRPVARVFLRLAAIPVAIFLFVLIPVLKDCIAKVRTPCAKMVEEDEVQQLTGIRVNEVSVVDRDDYCNADHWDYFRRRLMMVAVQKNVTRTYGASFASQLQSLKLADALCGNLADDQGLPDALKYRAWLSDSTTDARDRFTKGRGRLVMVNGLVFADSWSALLTGQLQNPLEVTEKSETYHSRVWTGTRPDGTAVPGAEHCADWSTSSFQKTGHYGYSDRTTPEWTISTLDDNPSGCPTSYALYCMQTL